MSSRTHKTLSVPSATGKDPVPESMAPQRIGGTVPGQLWSCRVDGRSKKPTFRGPNLRDRVEGFQALLAAAHHGD